MFVDMVSGERERVCVVFIYLSISIYFCVCVCVCSFTVLWCGYYAQGENKMEAVTSGSEAEDEQEPVSLGPRRPSSNRSYSSTLTASSGFLGVGSRSKGKRMSGESDAALTLGGLASPRSSVHTATPRSSFQVLLSCLCVHLIMLFFMIPFPPY